jgi:hypothetical protein
MLTRTTARAPGGELGSQFASASQPTLAAVWRTPGAALAQLAALRPPKPAPARKAKPAAAGACSPATPAPGLPAAPEAYSPTSKPSMAPGLVTAADMLAAEGLSPVQAGQLAATQTAGRGAAAASGAWADWPAGGSPQPDEPAARGGAPGAAAGGAAAEAGPSAAAGAAEAARTTAGDACPGTLAAADPDPACKRAALQGGSCALGLRDSARAGTGVPRGSETPPWLGGGGPPAGGAASPATAGGGLSLPRPQRAAAAPSRLRWPGGHAGGQSAGAPGPEGGPEEPEEALARCAAAWLPRDLAVAEAYLRAQGAAEVRNHAIHRRVVCTPLTAVAT